MKTTNHRNNLITVVLASLLAASAIGALLAQTPKIKPHAPPKPTVDFYRDIEPIFRVSCYTCHGPDKQQAGLRLDSKAFALKPGSGVIVPGKSKQSHLMQRVQGLDGLTQMPIGFAPLSKAQIALLAKWIDEGAVWPATPGVQKKHWAYVKPVHYAPPKVRLKTWIRNPIDNFVLAKLEKEHLTPSPEAVKEVLLRRVSLDLIGLPPSVKEVQAFLADKSPYAYENAVDRLLASPHFGERWARPWLDLARYADSNGYEKDARRTIWPYRDWVIAALNKDMPYSEFTIAQIAGDLLPNATPDQKIATGFHRNTLLNEEGGVDQEEQRWLTLVDRVGTTSGVWLGSTLQCAQCHNHKFDPFTQRDFYSMLAFFDHTTEPQIDVPTPEQETKRKALQADIAATEAHSKTLDAAKDKEAVQADKDKVGMLKQQIEHLDIPTTLVMAEKPGSDAPTTYMRVKGSFLAKSDLVTAAVPAALNPLPPGRPLNRLGLAYWLVDENNPLTARVAVNRFWEPLFGRGLVETSEDFGTQGTPPTHPELLDWLATEFMRRGWSMKTILRLIATSATYRQSSRVIPSLMERDPQNRLLARGPRFRMDAEMIRDSALSAAGLLSEKIGGPSVFPYQPDGIWVLPYNGDEWHISDGEDRFRRGLYTFWRRSAPYPAFVTFDATSREYCTVRRIRTTSPLQALTSLNDPAFFVAAQGLAKRMQKEGGTDIRSQIVYGFQCCVARRPKPSELNRLVALCQSEATRYQSDPKAAQALTGSASAVPDLAANAALTVVANVLLNLDETLTKE